MTERLGGGDRMSVLRVGLAQMNATVGALEANTSRIRERLEEARGRGVDVIAFPELAVCGYPPEDLLLRRSFVAANRAAVEELTGATRGLTALIGFVDRQYDLFNAAAVLHDGEWVATYHKQRLPNYGVFDELRYFKPGSSGEVLVRAHSAWIGVCVCEDIWLPGGPVGRLARAGADVIMNLNASPYHRGKWRARQRMLATRASDYAVAIGYVNMVGGQDELVFDGNSMILSAEGELIAEAPVFDEHLLVCDIELEQVFRARLHDPRRRHALRGEPHHVQRVMTQSRARPDADRPGRSPSMHVVHDDTAEVYGALVLGTRDYVRKNGFERVVIGLSGGIDSALVAAVAVDALGAAAVTGVKLPSRYSSEGSRADADALAANLGIELLDLGIEPIFRSALEVLSGPFAGLPQNLTEENLQARARGMLLMALSNKFGSMLLTTGNKSELATGYATLYGDMAGGFAPIKDVSKTLVYELARWRNARGDGPVIPESSITKPPSAELRPDQRDDDSLPPYDVLDAILQRYVEQDWSLREIIAEGHDEAVVRRVIGLVDASEYKRRQAAPGVKVTPRAFGRDRRLPITSGFREG
jgi:NAD+ synthase (glutamine-hydrolysing)